MYPLVYRLLTLVLILSVTTATMKRVFSSMNILKTRLCNRIGDQWINENLVVYIEKEIFDKIDDKNFMQCFHSMKTHREQL